MKNWQDRRYRFIGDVVMIRCNDFATVTYSNNAVEKGEGLTNSIDFSMYRSVCRIHSQLLTPCFHTFDSIKLNNLYRHSTNSIHIWDYNSNISISTTNADGVASMDSEKRASLKALADIALLRDNWNGNGAKAFSNDILAHCKALITQLNVSPDVYPTAEESIQFEWEKSNGDYLEIEFFEDKKCRKYLERCNGSWEMDFIELSMVGDLVDSFFAE